MWRTGAEILNDLGELAVVKSCEGFLEGPEYKITICVLSDCLSSPDKSKPILIQQLMEIIESVVSCHYSDKNREHIAVDVPCPKCVLTNVRQQTKGKEGKWEMRKVIKSFLERENTLSCDVSDEHSVAIEQVAPDVTFSNIPIIEKFSIEKKLGRGKATKILYD